MSTSSPRRFLLTCAGWAFAAGLGAPALSAQRSVEANTIRSHELPQASIRVDPALEHIGATTFVLGGETDVELHLFVEADGARVKRLLWVQFEGYRDTNSFTYDYSRDPTTMIQGRPFHVNARFYPTPGFAGRPGSDGDHAQKLLDDAGYTLGSDLARVRLVWLLNEPPRDELMLIYLEDLADHGLDVAGLREDDTSWSELAEGLLRRARATFEILEDEDR